MTIGALKGLMNELKVFMDEKLEKNHDDTNQLIGRETNRMKRELRDELKDLVREVVREEMEDAFTNETDTLHEKLDVMDRFLRSPQGSTVTSSQSHQPQLSGILLTVKSLTGALTKDVKAAVQSIEDLSRSVDERVEAVSTTTSAMVERLNKLSECVVLQTDTVTKRDNTLRTVLDTADEHFQGIADRMGMLVNKMGAGTQSGSSSGTNVTDASSEL